MARNELHNGQGAWLAFLRGLDVGLPGSAVFDIPDYSPELSALFMELGAPTYEHVLLNLTTLPYWLPFDAAPRDLGVLLGTENIPLLYTKNQSTIGNPRRIITQYRSKVGIRYCPACLSHDVLTVGEPYWHRVHQLPNVTSCPHHQVCLLSNCIKCKRRCSMQSSGRVISPRLICICGHDLSTNIIPAPIDKVRRKLVKISTNALKSVTPTDIRLQMHKFLLSQASVSGQKRIVEDAYQGYATRFSEADTQRMTDVNWVWFPDYRSMNEIRAVNVYALLAALDFDFVPDHFRSGKTEMVCVEAPTVDEARAIMLRYARKFPDAPPSRGTGINYWVLRLFDPDWLTLHYPTNKRFSSLPSINADRASIKQNMGSRIRRSDLRSDERTLVIQSAAGLRAQIRDRTWFAEHCIKCGVAPPRSRSMKSPLSSRPRKPKTTPTIVQHVKALSDAFHAALLEENYPAGLSVGELGVRARVSRGTAKAALRYDPRLFEEVLQARSALPRRRVIWAIRQLQAGNEPLTIESIMSRSSIAHSKSSRDLVKCVLAEITGNGTI
jgi:hypothetical protein